MLKKIAMFAGLPREHLARVEKISRKLSLQKGSILFAPGDATRGFYAVIDGAMRLYRVSPKGKEATMEIAGAGKIFAEASIFLKSYNCYAEALKDSIVYQIQKDKFLEMIQKDIVFAGAWISLLSKEVIHLRQRIEELTVKSPRERIISYVLLLSEMQDTARVILPIHRKSIATLLGMTHETFYRTAKELETEGLLRFVGEQIEIINRSLLEELVE